MTTIADYIEERWRDDSRDPAWHLNAWREIWDVVVVAELAKLVSHVDVPSPGPRATNAEIARYAPIDKLPPALVTAWRDAGRASFQIGDRELRWYSPTEIIDRRDELRALVTRSLRKSRPNIDVLATVSDATGPKALILFDPDQHPKNACYHFNKSESYPSLSWLIAVEMGRELHHELFRHLPDAFRLPRGARPGKRVERARLGLGPRFCDAIVDDTQVLTRSSTVKKLGTPSIRDFESPEAAKAHFAKTVGTWKSKGYRPT